MVVVVVLCNVGEIGIKLAGGDNNHNHLGRGGANAGGVMAVARQERRLERRQQRLLMHDAGIGGPYRRRDEPTRPEQEPLQRGHHRGGVGPGTARWNNPPLLEPPMGAARIMAQWAADPEEEDDDHDDDDDVDMDHVNPMVDNDLRNHHWPAPRLAMPVAAVAVAVAAAVEEPEDDHHHHGRQEEEDRTHDDRRYRHRRHNNNNNDEYHISVRQEDGTIGLLQQQQQRAPFAPPLIAEGFMEEDVVQDNDVVDDMMYHIGWVAEEEEGASRS